MRNVCLSVVALAAALLLCASARGQAKPDVWAVVDRAASLIGQRQFPDAVGVARRIIETDPKLPVGHTMLIAALEGSENDPGVIEACDALIAAFPTGPDVKKPDPLRQHQLWQYHANRHKGEALFRQKRFEEAATCFESAAKLAFDAARPMDASQTRRWQIEMRNRQADALWEAGKRADAVTLRQQVIAKFDRDRRSCFNCVRVKAALVRDLRALGRADEAKTLFDAALADERLDHLQKEFLDATLRARSGAQAEPRDALVARRTDDAFVIRSAGRFELHVNLATDDRYAMITSWYDLQSDPLRETDLLDDNWFTLFKPHHLQQSELVDGQWKNIDYNRYVQLRKAGKLGVGYTKEQNAFEVVETTPARVRFGTTNRSWPGERVIYTVYPDGRIYVGTHWTPTRPDGTIRIRGMGFYTGVSGTVNWRTTLGDKTGMFGSPYISGQAPFTMMHSNENYPTVLDATRADLAKCLTKPTSSYGNNTLFLAWFRTPVAVRFDPEREREADVACFIHIWPNDRNSYDAALPYVQDYQTPAKPDVTKGTLVTDDAGDYDRDGFNEAEGCTVVRADGDAVELTLDGRDVKRFSPVFKVTGLKRGAEAVVVELDGKRLVKGESLAAHVDAASGVALVRIVGTVSTQSAVRMRFVPDERR